MFIAARLAIAFSALAFAPFFLAFRGAPSAVQILVFACSFAPLAAAVLVARTGRLAVGHGVAAAGLVGLGLSLDAGLKCGVGCTIAWLIAAQVEVWLSGEKRLTYATALVCGLAAIIVLTAAALETDPGTGQPLVAAVFGGLACLYATVVLIGGAVADVTPDPRADTDDEEIFGVASRLLADLVVGFDASGSVVRVCAARDDPFGIAAADLSGRGLFEHVHVADRPAFLKLVADAVHDDDTAPAKFRLRTLDTTRAEMPARPKHAWIEMRARRVGSNQDDPRRAVVVAVLRDVDASHAYDVEIAAAQISVADAIRSKDHFLANMSHELRTPLNAIIGFSEMLASHTLRPSDADKQREYARIIHQSGQHLLSVVNSILDMSKIRSGSFAIVPETFDVGPLLDLACDIVALKAEEGRVELVRDYPEHLEEIVGDKRACKQILINLLSNAVKFTPESGHVTLSARPEGNALVIAVSDTGIGIAASDLARLGDPFFQARSSLSRPFEGTGLGLSVVRGLVGLHGGTIALESELGRGTRVKVHLPLDCRAIGPAKTSATIETLARRQTLEPNVSRIDRRMKQSA